MQGDSSVAWCSLRKAVLTTLLCVTGFVVATRFSTDLRSAVRSRSVGTVGTEELAEAAREQENPEEQQNCPYELKFLGMSYDLAQGMPQPWQSKNSHGETGDEDCSYESRVWEISSGMDFQSSLKEIMRSSSETGAELAPEAFFTQSSEFRFLQNGSRTHTYTLTTAACGIYGAELDVEALQLSGAFLAAVEALPYPVTAENEKDYEKFLGTWGTHYSVKVTMGARISRLLQFDKGEGLAAPFDAQSMAQADFQKVLDAAVDPSGAKADGAPLTAFNICLGADGSSCLPRGLSAQRWRAEAALRPVPVEAELSSILNLLNEACFKINELTEEETMSEVMPQQFRCLACKAVIYQLEGQLELGRHSESGQPGEIARWLQFG
eukprot:g1118.t1